MLLRIFSWNQYQFRTSIQWTLESRIVFFPPVYGHPCKRPYAPLGERRKANSKILRNFFQSLSQGNPTVSSFKGLWVCKTAQVWKLIHGTRLPFATIQSSLYFICLRTFLLIQIKQRFSDLLIYSMPGNTRSISRHQRSIQVAAP